MAQRKLTQNITRTLPNGSQAILRHKNDIVSPAELKAWGVDDFDGVSEPYAAPLENKQRRVQAEAIQAMNQRSLDAGDISATDAASELAKEKGVDLATVKGTGADGRILVSDVEGAVATGDPADAPTPDANA